MKGIKYVASVLDYSGYGNAARKNLIALKEQGIPVTVTNVSFATNEALIPDFEIKQMKELINKEIDYDVVIIHLTPENFARFIEKDKFNIGHFAWETTNLHFSWLPFCNAMDLILVPCEWNREVLINSLVTTPIKVFEHAYDVNKFENTSKHQLMSDEENLKFYSIFQWSERKNPEALLRTYFSEFDENDKVVLYLKTYIGTSSEEDKNKVIKFIEKSKASINKKAFPKIILLPDLMSEEQVNQLHLIGDCYLAPIRGEGFGMPILDAALAGNDVVCTNFSAPTSFLSQELHYLISFQLEPVSNMNWIPWYLANQNWASVHEVEFMKAMRSVYHSFQNNLILKKRSDEKKILYKKWLKEYFSNKQVVQRLIVDIEEALNGK